MSSFAGHCIPRPSPSRGPSLAPSVQFTLRLGRRPGGIKIRFLRNRILYIGEWDSPYTFLVGQTRATLCTAAGQHLAAVCRMHALAETMLLGALALLRLIRSLHSLCTSLFSKFTDGHRHRSGYDRRAYAAACPHDMRQYLLSYKKRRMSRFFCSKCNLSTSWG